MKSRMGVIKLSLFVLLLTILVASAVLSQKWTRKTIELGDAVNAANAERDEDMARLFFWQDLTEVPLSIQRAIHTGSWRLSKENIQRDVSTLHPQIKQILFYYLRKRNLLSDISGEEDSLEKWYTKHFRFLFDRSSVHVPPTQKLARVLLYSMAPAPSPAPVPSRSKASSQSTFRSLEPLFPPPYIYQSTLQPSSSKESFLNSNLKPKSNNDNKVIIAVIITAAVTSLMSAFVFLCYRKCRRGYGVHRNDDRPFLTLSLSTYSTSSSQRSSPFGSSRIHERPLPADLNHIKPQNQKTCDTKLYSESNFVNGLLLETPQFINGNPKVLVPFKSSEIVSATIPIEQDSSERPKLSSFQPSSLKPPPGRANPLPPPLSTTTTTTTMSSPPPPPQPCLSNLPSQPPPLPKFQAMKPASRPPPPPPPKSDRPPPTTPMTLKEDRTSFSGSHQSNVVFPKTKLKPFFWDKVLANSDHSMVWHQIKSGSFQFNEEMIETLFGYVPPADKGNNNNVKKDISQDPSTQYVQLIDSKKAQNLSILLRALNVTTEEVCDALREGNELPAELVVNLLKMAPTAEEELKLRLFNGHISQLSPAERFLKILVEIPFAFKRLEALLFMTTLQEEASVIRDSFATLEVACRELKSSRLFLKLLEAVLKTGNRMNDGTFRGGAQAFKLDTLLKLADVKGADGKTTLLHFVVQEIIRSEGVRASRAPNENPSTSTPDESSEENYRKLGLRVVSGLSGELENVKKAAALDGDVLAMSVTKLGQGLVKARDLLNSDMKTLDLNNNGFFETLKSFVEHAEIDIGWLSEEDKRVVALVKSTGDYFHGNAGRDEGLRLFVIVRDFLIMLDRVCREVRDSQGRVFRSKNRVNNEASPATPSSSPDIRKQLFPAIVGRRADISSSDEDTP